jgi:hypothetical protein
LFDCLLGQLPGFFSTGELAYIWTHGLQENRLCGCGARFLDCEFWTEVGRVAFGGWERVDADRMRELELSVNRHRYVPFLVEPRLSRAFRRSLEGYTDVLSRIYAAIAVISGNDVIVDSTIDPAYGLLLRHVPSLDLRVVHVVRDSRATAFSWTRWQRRTDRVDTEMYQRRFRPPVTALRWMIYHGLTTALETLQREQLVIRYEDVVADPAAQIRRVTSFIDRPISSDDLSFLGQGQAEMGVNHTVAGSVMRLNCGPLAIRLDDEWTRALPKRQRLAVNALSFPLLRHYGYVDRALWKRAPRPDRAFAKRGNR